MTPIFVLLLTVFAADGSLAVADQKPARINACTVLTREMVTSIATATKAKMNSQPAEAPVGINGSSCDYGGIQLQVDPFAAADQMRKSPRKDWEPVSGVGDTAYFHNVRDFMAELLVWSGSHHFGILMDVPVGAKAEQIKPHMIQAANQIASKLK